MYISKVSAINHLLMKVEKIADQSPEQSVASLAVYSHPLFAGAKNTGTLDLIDAKHQVVLVANTGRRLFELVFGCGPTAGHPLGLTWVWRHYYWVDDRPERCQIVGSLELYFQYVVDFAFPKAIDYRFLREFCFKYC